MTTDSAVLSSLAHGVVAVAAVVFVGTFAIAAFVMAVGEDRAEAEARRRQQLRVIRGGLR